MKSVRTLNLVLSIRSGLNLWPARDWPPLFLQRTSYDPAHLDHIMVASAHAPGASPP